MSFARGPIIPINGLVFYFDALNKKCYTGGSEFKDLITKTNGNAIIGPTQSLAIENKHLRFISDEISRSCYISYIANDLNLPKGNLATWSWSHYFIDSGSISHQNFGNGTTNSGFVFRTGWGTDGPRWHIGGESYLLYGDSPPSRYQNTVWQHYTVTFNGLIENGLKTYLDGVLVDERTPIISSIGEGSNNLYVGADPWSGGNWNGYQDMIQIWDRPLTQQETLQNFNATKSRFL